MKKHCVPFILVASVLAIPSLSQASSSYMTAFNTLYPKATSLSCSVCHTSVPALNPYGTTFKTKHTGAVTPAKALTLSEPVDSDGDGFTNLTEITATTATAKSFPGVKTSIPAKLLFFDNLTNAKATILPNWQKISGTWSGNGTVLTATQVASNLLLANANTTTLKTFNAGTVSARVQLFNVAGTTPNASFVFSYAGPASYRYITIDSTQIKIGQVGAVGGVAAGDKATAVFAPGTTAHNYRVVTTATGWVYVYADTATTATASFKFPTAVAGRIGLLTNKAKATFDNYRASK